MNNALPKWINLGLIPLLNLATALLISGIVIQSLGGDPFYALELLIEGAFGYGEGVSYTLYYTTHFIFTGLAVSLAYRAGLFNIGGEGQAMMGGLGLLLMVQLAPDLPAMLLIPLSIMSAALFGALWALIPALLQAKRDSHIVITTIMFNFIAASLLSYALVGPLRRASGQATESEDLPLAAQLPSFEELFQSLGAPEGPANMSLFVAVLCLVLYGLFINRTRWGYNIRVVGLNPGAADFAGISNTR
ncbi:MAG: ABC transporter permease, partial [Sphingomonadales bacterium]|nr:ABC transporter permease [Sphingomonadales bacterium]